MKLTIEWDDKVPMTEFSLEFVQGMADRMIASYFKYGSAKDAYPQKVDAVKTGQNHIKLYQEGGEVKGNQVPSGNKELLIDAANYDMIEFLYPRNPDAYFKATDKSGSIGRAWNDGTTSEKSVKREGMESEHRFVCCSCGRTYCHPLQYCQSCPGRIIPRYGK